MNIRQAQTRVFYIVSLVYVLGFAISIIQRLAATGTVALELVLVAVAVAVTSLTTLAGASTKDWSVAKLFLINAVVFHIAVVVTIDIDMTSGFVFDAFVLAINALLIGLLTWPPLALVFSGVNGATIVIVSLVVPTLDPWLSRQYPLLIFAVLGAGMIGYVFGTAFRKTHRSVQEDNRRLDAMSQKLHETQKNLVKTEALAMNRHMAVGIAHEINSPLGVLLTSLSYFESNILPKVEGVDPEVRKLIALSRRSVDRMTAVIERVKDLSLLEVADGVSSSRLSEAVDDAVRHIYIHLGRELEPSIVAGGDMNLDHGTLWSKIFVVCFENSLEYAHGSPAREVVIEVGAKNNDSSTVVWISDDGPGLPAEVEKSAFAPFQRYHRPQGHLGIGLSILANLVRGPLRGEVRYIAPSGENPWRLEIEVPLFSQS